MNLTCLPWRRKRTAHRETSPAIPVTTESQRQPENSQPQQRSGPELFPSGIEVLHSCENPTVDICFVHGLTGDRTSTWKHQSQAEPWPKAILPLRLPRARILTFGYNAYVLRASVASKARLIDHASSLLDDLTTERANNSASSRPIIFVAHSLGGIVCKETILQSMQHAETHLNGIFECTKAMIFMGTPHEGSWMAQWASLAAKGIGKVKSTNSDLLDILKVENQFLESINVNFLSMIRKLEPERTIGIVCFFEEFPLTGVGQVVSKSSATFPGYLSLMIHGNHREMTKFASENDSGFNRVVGQLTRWESEIRSHTKSSESAGHAVAASNSASSLDTADSMDEKRNIIVLNLLQVLFDEPFKTRAFKAARNIIKALDQEDALEDLLHSQSRPGDDPFSQSQTYRDIAKTLTGAYKDARSRCLKSLTFSEMGDREASIGRPTEHTSTWIYTNPEYTSWDKSLNTLLWIKGKPGSGKSTLMRDLIRKRKGSKSDPDNVRLSFFFNARGSALEQTPTGLYITLLHALLQEIPLIMCEFLPLFLKKELKDKEGKVSWQLAEIADFFHATIGQSQSQSIEVMVDALDECKDDEVRDVIFRFERSIVDARSSGGKLKACWSSRNYPNISLRYNSGVVLQLDTHNHDDIHQYVMTELAIAQHPRLDHIHERLISRANGVFLWAVLVSKRLAKGVDQGKDESQLEQMLDSIPSKLEDLFDEIFVRASRFAEDHRDLLLIVQWILCGFRPLSPVELYTALMLQNSHSPIALKDVVLLDDFDVSTNRSSSRDSKASLTTDMSSFNKKITDLTSGLVELPPIVTVYESGLTVVSTTGIVMHPPGFVTVKSPTRVQFIHESVREYFLGPKGLQLLQMPSKEHLISAGHKALALGCFRALLAKEFDENFAISGIKDFASLADARSLLTVPWKPLKNRFLMDYVPNSVFEHLTLSQKHLSGDTTIEFPIESIEARRRTLVNFIRLTCSGIVNHPMRRKTFNAHIRKVENEFAVFGFKKEEFLQLLASPYNLSAFSQLLLANYRFLKQPNEGFSLPFRVEKPSTYLALVYLSPRLREIDLPISIFFTSPINSENFKSSEINFCYCVAFKASPLFFPDALSSEVSSWRIGSMSYIGVSFPDEPPVESIMDSSGGDFTEAFDWRFAEDVHELHDFRAYESILNPLPKARLQDCSDPDALCLFLRHPEELHEPVKRFIENPEIKGNWSDDHLSNIVINFTRLSHVLE